MLGRLRMKFMVLRERPISHSMAALIRFHEVLLVVNRNLDHLLSLSNRSANVFKHTARSITPRPARWEALEEGHEHPHSATNLPAELHCVLIVQTTRRSYFYAVGLDLPHRRFLPLPLPF